MIWLLPQWFQWFLYRLIVLVVAVLVLLGVFTVAQWLEQPVQDTLIRWTAQRVENSPVQLVLIDDASLVRLKHRFGPLPWPRSAYVDMVNRIRALGASVVVLDSHFRAESPSMEALPAEDLQAVKTLSAMPNAILGLADEPGRIWEAQASSPLPRITPNMGVVNTRQDADQVVRRIEPIYLFGKNAGGIPGVLPSLSLSAAENYLRRTSNSDWMSAVDRNCASHMPFGISTDRCLLLQSEGDTSAPLLLPLDRSNQMMLRWYKIPSNSAHHGFGEHSHPAISVFSLYEDQWRQKISGLRGKIVLLGSSASTHHDVHESPISSRHLGVDIHATAISNLLSSQSLTPVSGWLVWIVACSSMLLLLIVRRYTPTLSKSLIYVAFCQIGYFWWVLYQLAESGILWPVILPEVLMVFGFVTGTIMRTQSESKRMKAMEQALGQLVSPAIFREIQQRYHRLAPEGQRMTITSLFVDVRSFTALAEQLPPGQLTEFLNAFYSMVVPRIFEHQGTVDKFMGDGILAFFGAPIPNETHASQAIAAARDILAQANQLASDWEKPFGRRMQIGVSIHSGPAFVGFVGPPDKLEYTAIGDTVNLCIRLQQHNKRFGVGCILSEHTKMLLSDTVPTQSLGEVMIQGRETPLEIYQANL